MCQSKEKKVFRGRCSLGSNILSADCPEQPRRRSFGLQKSRKRWTFEWLRCYKSQKLWTMESILRGIVSSEHSPTLKKQLLQKLFTGWNRSETNHNDCIELFKLFIEWILVSDKSDLRKLGNYCLVKSLFSISVRNNGNCLEFLTKESFWRTFHKVKFDEFIFKYFQDTNSLYN